MISSLRRIAGMVHALCLTGLALPGCTGLDAAQSDVSLQEPVASPSREVTQYLITPTSTVAARNAIARTGVAIDEVGPDYVIISLPLESELAAIERLGFSIHEVEAPSLPPVPLLGVHRAALSSADFVGPGNYHTADSLGGDNETLAELLQAELDHPTIVRVSYLANTLEGRRIPIVKISDNVDLEEGEPEVLFFCNEHAREHLTTELCLYIVRLFTDEYATAPNIQALVDSRVTWVVPALNADGKTYDIDNDLPRHRKNRRPTSGLRGNKPVACVGTEVGVDLNRNWDGYSADSPNPDGSLWGCCGGSSDLGCSSTYRGPAALTEPEVLALKAFVDSRVIGGVQMIKVANDIHSYGSLILYPPDFTLNPTPNGMTQDMYDTYVALANGMAASNGYTPRQAANNYITDGASFAYLHFNRAFQIFAMGFELYPETSTPGFYPPVSDIAPETQRNREAVLDHLRVADCPYRVLGEPRASQYCAPATCGDNIRQGAEVCDGADLAGATCVSIGYYCGAGVSCNVGCASFDSSQCVAGSCGDGLVQCGEVCDPNGNVGCNVAAGQTCSADCAACVTGGGSCTPQGVGPCGASTNCCSGVGNCSGGKPGDRVCL